MPNPFPTFKLLCTVVAYRMPNGFVTLEQLTMSVIVARYCIARIFRGRNFRELVEKWNFAEKYFVECSLRPSLQTIAEKTFAERHKTAKFATVSPSIVSLYTVYFILCLNY